jgi:hypothetical protein
VGEHRESYLFAFDALENKEQVNGLPSVLPKRTAKTATVNFIFLDGRISLDRL